ncbi:MAG: hypothetical protein JST68_20695 [Bacteroidetes bacterium]|nr:hypothetical protein [Bacteroidota bacterium]
MRSLLLTLLFVSMIAAAFSCQKTNNEDLRITDPLPGIPLIWRGEQSYAYAGASGSGFITPDSTTILVLNPDQSYWIQGDRSIGQRGTYKFDTTRAAATGNPTSIDTFLVLTPGPTLKKDVKLAERLLLHFSNDSVYLRSPVSPGGYTINYFRTRP